MNGRLNKSHSLIPYRCDDGFSGQDCQPSSPLTSSVLSDFESQDALLATWQEVIGGEVVAPDMGCGVVSSGSSLYFSKVDMFHDLFDVTRNFFLFLCKIQMEEQQRSN